MDKIDKKKILKFISEEIKDNNRRITEMKKVIRDELKGKDIDTYNLGHFTLEINELYSFIDSLNDFKEQIKEGEFD